MSYLRISENPLCDKFPSASEYRKHVLRVLPHLHKLDDLSKTFKNTTYHIIARNPTIKFKMLMPNIKKIRACLKC